MNDKDIWEQIKVIALEMSAHKRPEEKTRTEVIELLGLINNVDDIIKGLVDCGLLTRRKGAHNSWLYTPTEKITPI
jgi:hypothetical protein